MKAIGLLSGGLDSTLALELMLEQNIEIITLNFKTPFCRCNHGGCNWASKQANRIGVGIKYIYLGDEYLETIKNPKFGYGSQVNPCIDCRILMFKKAKEFMKEINASFIFTGEVLGQRPMSQHMNALRLIEREAGLEGLIIRPLSARLLPPSIPEKEGWIEREALRAIRGRSRKEQIRLAKKVGLHDYPCPAGGCLLTDPNFAKRIKDLLKHSSNLTLNDVELLKVGRHFRLSSSVKLIVGRNEKENERLSRLRRNGDVSLFVSEHKGPTSILRGNTIDHLIILAAGITAYYSDAPKDRVAEVSFETGNETNFICVRAAPYDELKQFMI